MRKGDILRVVDPMGERVSDLFAVDAVDHSRCLSSGRTNHRGDLLNGRVDGAMHALGRVRERLAAGRAL